MVKPKLTKDRSYAKLAVPPRPRRGKAHIFGVTHAGHRTSLGGRTGFDYPVTQEGATANFAVYYDPALGANGKSALTGSLQLTKMPRRLLSQPEWHSALSSRRNLR
jgi:hypothetical protein